MSLFCLFVVVILGEKKVRFQPVNKANEWLIEDLAPTKTHRIVCNALCAFIGDIGIPHVMMFLVAKVMTLIDFLSL